MISVELCEARQEGNTRRTQSRLTNHVVVASDRSYIDRIICVVCLWPRSLSILVVSLLRSSVYLVEFVCSVVKVCDRVFCNFANFHD